MVDSLFGDGWIALDLNPRKDLLHQVQYPGFVKSDASIASSEENQVWLVEFERVAIPPARFCALHIYFVPFGIGTFDFAVIELFSDQISSGDCPS